MVFTNSLTISTHFLRIFLANFNFLAMFQIINEFDKIYFNKILIKIF